MERWSECCDKYWNPPSEAVGCTAEGLDLQLVNQSELEVVSCPVTAGHYVICFKQQENLVPVYVLRAVSLSAAHG
jgi:hypothetical protein